MGGLIGRDSGTVTTGTASGVVVGETYGGGLVGLNYAALRSSSASGATKGTGYVGGLVGWITSYGLVRNSSATDTVSATTAYLDEPKALPGL